MSSTTEKIIPPIDLSQVADHSRLGFPFQRIGLYRNRRVDQYVALFGSTGSYGVYAVSEIGIRRVEDWNDGITAQVTSMGPIRDVEGTPL